MIKMDHGWIGPILFNTLMKLTIRTEDINRIRGFRNSRKAFDLDIF